MTPLTLDEAQYAYNYNLNSGFDISALVTMHYPPPRGTRTKARRPTKRGLFSWKR